jgi:hypothetical protein
MAVSHEERPKDSTLNLDKPPDDEQLLVKWLEGQSEALQTVLVTCGGLFMSVHFRLTVGMQIYGRKIEAAIG